MDERFLKWFGKSSEKNTHTHTHIEAKTTTGLFNSTDFFFLLHRVAQTIPGTSSAVATHAAAHKKSIDFDTTLVHISIQRTICF